MQLLGGSFSKTSVLLVAMVLAVGASMAPMATADDDRERGEEGTAPVGIASDGMTVIPDATVADIAGSAAGDDTGFVSGATFDELPPAAEDVGAHGVSDQGAVALPTAGDTFAVLTNGVAGVFHHSSEFASVDLGGDLVRGEYDLDVTVMQVEIEGSPLAECGNIDYRFLTHEFPGAFYRDGLVIEEGQSEWTTTRTDGIVAPDALAVESARASEEELAREHAEGVPYDYGTPLHNVTFTLDGGTTDLYFSVFDWNDPRFDSAGVVDNVYLGTYEDGACIPVVPPGEPRALEATPDQGEVELSWQAPANDGTHGVDRYNVYRAVQGDDPELVDSTADTSFTDTGLANGQNYVYEVTAANEKVEGPASTVEATTLPSAPQDLTAEPGALTVGGPSQAGTVDLDWNDPGDAAEILAYHVYREGAGLVGSVAGDVTEFSDDVQPVNTDAPGDGYTYTVTAENAGGEGAGAQASSMAIPPALAPPTLP